VEEQNAESALGSLRRRVIAGALAGAVLAASVPVLASLYLSWNVALTAERGKLRHLAREAVARSERVFTTARDGLGRLQRPDSELCTDAHLAAMQAMTFSSPYLQEFAVIRDGQLVCTSWGRLATPATVGPPDYVSPTGFRVWYAWEAKAVAPGRRAIAVAQGSMQVLIDPAHLVDVVTDKPSLALLVFALPSRSVLSATSAAQAESLAASFDPAGIVLDDDRLVTYAASDLVPLAAAASAPRSELVDAWRSYALRLLPFGVLAALIMIGLVLWLANRRLSLRGELEAAIKGHEFEVHYQPIVSLETGRCLAAEALVRWRRADGTSVRPDLFIPLAEETGLIVPITAQVVRTVARELGGVLRANPDLRVSINLSAADIAAPSTRQLLAEALQAGGMRPSQLALEITERGAVDPRVSARAMAELRAAGHQIYIDDFGTGYSNLSYLETLHVDGIKIDKAFVDAVGADAATSGVIGHIIDMARSLRLAVVAEGVETGSQAEFLRARGVPMAQGWLYGKAVAVAEFKGLVARPRLGPSGVLTTA
jgi:sensor c-di-GMP phosphodiesterase-like protein